MKTTDEKEKLRREISKRWPLVGHDVIARGQLEYILQEAGLLVKPRKRRKKAADESLDLIGGGPRHTKD